MLNNKVEDIKVIVWDFDGTLHVSRESAQAMEKTFIRIIANHESLNIKEAEKLFIKKTRNVSWSKATSIITGIKELDVLTELEENINRLAFVKIDQELVKLFNKLSKFRHIILTNAIHKNITSALKQMGFPKDKNNQISPFEKIFSIDKTGSFKPNAEIFKNILTYTKLPPDQHLIVGDSLKTDILPAKKLKFRTCLVGGEEKTEPNYHLNSVYELPFLFSPHNKLLNSIVAIKKRFL